MLLFTEYRCLFVFFLTDISLQSIVDLLLYIVVNAFTLSISAKQTCRVSAIYLLSAVVILLYEICPGFFAVQELLLIFCLFCHFPLPLSIFVLYCYDKSPGPYEILSPPHIFCIDFEEYVEWIWYNVLNWTKMRAARHCVDAVLCLYWFVKAHIN